MPALANVIKVSSINSPLERWYQTSFKTLNGEANNRCSIKKDNKDHIVIRLKNEIQRNNDGRELFLFIFHQLYNNYSMYAFQKVFSSNLLAEPTSFSPPIEAITAKTSEAEEI